MNARWWLFALLGLNAAWVTDLFVLGHELSAPGGMLTALGRLTGLYGALALVLQLVLISRLPWLESRLGLDRLTLWHRWTGFWVLWLLVAHVVFIVLGYAGQDGSPVLAEMGTLVFHTQDVLLATIAFVLLVAVGVTSARAARRRLRYESWHLVHLLAYLAVVLGFLHQVTVGQDFTGAPLGRLYWWTLYGAALGLVAVSRIGLPLARNLRHRLRVESVVREADDVVSLVITGHALDALPARAGQFFLWRFLTPAHWWEAHPYSLSAMPDGRRLRITVKALGDGSGWLQHVRPGTRVFAEGPYGAFTAQRRTRRRVLLIAGGVGVTPVRALLEEFARQRDDIALIYRASTADSAVLADELRRLASRCSARMFLVLGPSTGVGRFGPVLGPRHLHAMVPDVRRRDVYLCGPPGMTDAVRRTLTELAVPAEQCHTERFAFAA
ncbi:ferredoxin reductase family protein [Amycolatopsis acidiphila]|uniref:ferredoxin reductase family protein n=1 Tax=Amycolatopsis acidiphila TaxID=715473 RepID=UPI001E37806A|nr:ferredoxin reductase family protein [Amycolatopsis acidiphila]UIJ63298.1 ferredoxin reductase family protein [Amycolatopsis acidiphila]